MIWAVAQICVVALVSPIVGWVRAGAGLMVTTPLSNLKVVVKRWCVTAARSGPVRFVAPVPVTGAAPPIEADTPTTSRPVATVPTTVRPADLTARIIVVLRAGHCGGSTRSSCRQLLAG